MNDLSCSLTYVSETYLWLETYEDLKRFVTEALNLKGKWKAPGGDVKIFKSEGEEYIIKWLGPPSRKLFIQSDDAEENLKSKLGKLINWGPNNANSLCEASVNEVCSSVGRLIEPSVSQFSSFKADFASLVDITSDLITQINSMRSKQKDFESVIRKQDSEICRLRACSYGQKFSRLARKHFDKFTSEISPSYENSMKSYLAFIYETKSFPVYRDLAC